MDCKCCRLCKFFDGVACTNTDAFSFDDSYNLSMFSEEGWLAKAIRDGFDDFDDFDFSDLEMELADSAFSDERVKGIINSLRDDVDYAIRNCTEKIDVTVSSALKSFNFGIDESVVVKNPAEFSCAFFM